MMISATAAPAATCQKAALAALRASAPDGYAVYQQVKDKSFLLHWIGCNDPQFGLPTAVHESVHFLTAEADAFPLVNGGEIMRPHEASRFFPPSRIASEFKTDDFVSTYLRPGRASSASDFLYLLDELNAYTHDLNAAVDLKQLSRDDEYADNRDGLAALMAFVALYVERAKAREPETWSGLRAPEVAKTLATLWDRAEATLASSCGIPHFGAQDKAYIGRFCAADASAALGAVIGRDPVCPTACLKDEAAADIEAAPEPERRTLWSRRTGRAHAAAASAGEATE